MAEVRHLVPAGRRTREELIRDLRAALDDLEESEESDDVRTEVWWDADAPEVWMRTTSGPRIRWTIAVVPEGIEFLVRGPFGIRCRRPRVVRWLMNRLAAG